jgi:hypothetical protein
MLLYLDFLSRRQLPRLLATLIWTGSPLQARSQSNESAGTLTAKLRGLRAECEEAASSVKAAVSDSSTKYLAARRDYGKARASVEEVIGLLRQALLNGSEAEIAQSQNLRRAAEDALRASSAFLATADLALKKPQSRNVAAVVAVLSSIVAVALEIVKLASSSAELGEKVEDRRRKRAEQLEAELVWKSWADLPGKKT